MTKLEQIMVKMGFDVSEASKVGDAMNKVKEGTKKGGEGIDGFNTKGREMNELINKIGASSPVLGSALKACFSPEAAGIALFLGALEFVKSQIEKVEEKVKELTQEMREMWLSEQDSAMKAQEVYEAYQQKISEILDSKNQKLENEAKAYERQLAALKNITGEHEKVLAKIYEVQDADQKRQRAKEDKTLDARQEKELAGAGTEAAKDAIRKRYELEKEAINNRREYEDAVTKRQREKQADADAATAEKATQTAMANRLKALEAAQQKSLDDGKSLAQAQKKQLADKYALEAEQGKNLDNLKKEMAKADAEVNRRGGGSVLHNLARTASYAMGETGAALREQDDAGLADAQKKQADLQAQYTKMLKDRAELQKKIEESTKKISENEADVQARNTAINELKQQQKDLNQQIAQNQLQRRAIGGIADAELNRLKGDLGMAQAMSSGNLAAWWTGNSGDFSLTGQVGRDYAARHGGFGLPSQIKTNAKEDQDKQQTDFLKDIRDILAGDK